MPLVITCLGPLFMKLLITNFYKNIYIFFFVLRLCFFYFIKHNLCNEDEDLIIYEKKIKFIKES